MDLNVEKLRKYIDKNFQSNIAEAARRFNLKRDTLTKVLNKKRNAGIKVISAIRTYFYKNNIDFNFFVT